MLSSIYDQNRSHEDYVVYDCMKQRRTMKDKIDWSNVDWQKLDGYCNAITASIMKKLPGDYHLSFDEVKSEVNIAFVTLIKLYAPKTGGMSLTSWCYKYAEKIAFTSIKKEYKRLKKQLCYEEVFSDKYEYTENNSQCIKHQYGRYYDLTVDSQIIQTIEFKDLADCLVNFIKPFDMKLIEMHFIQQMSYNSMSKKLKIPKRKIQYLVDKCMRKLKSIRNF